MHACTKKKHSLFVCFWRDSPQWARASSFMRFLDHTQQRTTVGRTPLDEWSTCRRNFYLTTHNTDNRQTSMPPVGFEPTISAGERPQTYALDRAATGISKKKKKNRVISTNLDVSAIMIDTSHMVGCKQCKNMHCVSDDKRIIFIFSISFFNWGIRIHIHKHDI